MKKRGFTLVEIMIVLAIIGLIVSIAVPAFLKNRRDAQGSACNGQLDAIFSAMEQIAFKMNAKQDVEVKPSKEELDSYLRGFSVIDLCPMGGTYAPRGGVEITNSGLDGQVYTPTCTANTEIEAAGDATTVGERGLHIHRRSYEIDATTGKYAKIGTAVLMP